MHTCNTHRICVAGSDSDSDGDSDSDRVMDFGGRSLDKSLKSYNKWFLANEVNNIVILSKTRNTKLALLRWAGLRTWHCGKDG